MRSPRLNAAYGLKIIRSLCPPRERKVVPRPDCSYRPNRPRAADMMAYGFSSHYPPARVISMEWRCTGQLLLSHLAL